MQGMLMAKLFGRSATRGTPYVTQSPIQLPFHNHYFHCCISQYGGILMANAWEIHGFNKS